MNSLSLMGGGASSAADAWGAGFDALNMLPGAAPSRSDVWSQALLTAGGGIASYFTTKSANKNARKLLRLQLQARALGIGMPAGAGAAQLAPLGGTAPTGTGYSTAAYLTGPDGVPIDGGGIQWDGAGGGAMEASMAGALPALVGAGRALLTSPRVLALARSLAKYVGAAGAVELAARLIDDGVDAGDGPYANPKHNKCTGILRGDVMAVRRVKRQGKRLMRTLRMAGAVPRAGRFRGARRRRC